MGCEKGFKGGCLSTVLTEHHYSELASGHFVLLSWQVWSVRNSVILHVFASAQTNVVLSELECLLFGKKYKCECSETCTQFSYCNTKHESNRSLRSLQKCLCVWTVCLPVIVCYVGPVLTEPLGSIFTLMLLFSPGHTHTARIRHTQDACACLFVGSTHAHTRQIAEKPHCVDKVAVVNSLLTVCVQKQSIPLLSETVYAKEKRSTCSEQIMFSLQTWKTDRW